MLLRTSSRSSPDIVTTTDAALLGGVFLAMALAFGLGGRDVANRVLSEAYDRGREHSGRFRRDVSAGRDRAGAAASRRADGGAGATAAEPSTRRY